MKQNEFHIWIIFYIVIWITRLFSIYTGSYWHSFITEEIIERKETYFRVISFMAYFTQDIAIVVWFVLSILYFAKYKLNKGYRNFFKFLIIAEIIFYFPTGSKLKILIPIIGYFLAGFILKQNIRKQFAVFLLIFVLFLPVHNMFRVTSKISINATIGEVSYLSRKGYLFSAVDSLFKRADCFSCYFGFVEQYRDFLYGKSYIPALFALIPRPFWVGKPAAINVNKLGREYGIIGEYDFLTSPGLGIWTEAFINFGYVGLFLMWIIVSLVSILLFRYMIRVGDIFGIALCSYITIWFFVSVTGFLVGLFGSIIKMFVMFGILRIIMASVEKSRMKSILPEAR